MIREIALAGVLAKVAAAGILDECININFRQDWLVADCLQAKGSSARINSAVYIDNKLTNNDGNLRWQANGGYRLSCRDCALIGLTYTCTCRPNFGQYRATSINLEEHIANYNGFLLSNLTGPARIPSASSPIPVPADFSYSLKGGALSCTSPEQYDECDRSSPSPQPADCGEATIGSSHAGEECLVDRWYFPWEVYTSFQSVSPVPAVSGAWNFAVYGNHRCDGAVLGRAAPGTCTKFSRYGVGVKVEPLFNGNWRV
ncbi:CVNH domain-containing protein [Microdochium nivale]|nr:CVNH domain-containing protein [Microdochium nivale]